MTDGRQSNHDWTIHSLNIHGIFFERWCRKTIRESRNWALVSTNYPVAYKPDDSHWAWRESELDLRAIHGGSALIGLSIKFDGRGVTLTDSLNDGRDLGSSVSPGFSTIRPLDNGFASSGQCL
jgi:hypothetical protein